MEIIKAGGKKKGSFLKEEKTLLKREAKS